MTTTRVFRATAVRTTVNGKATLTVTHAGHTWTIGGKRAERAQVVLVGKHPDYHDPECIGARMDPAAAQGEAARMAGATGRRTKFGHVPVTPWEWVIPVPVTDE